MGKTTKVYVLATIIQFMMGVLIFGTGYALVLYLGKWSSSALTCGIIGVVHGLAVGLSLPLIARYDPAVRSGHSRNPGLLALNYGAVAATGLVLLHVVYGVVFGLVYYGGPTLMLSSAWLAGLVATAVMTVFILIGKAIRLAEISTIDLIAATLSEVLR